MTPHVRPLADRDAVVASVRLLVPPGHVTELRALQANMDGSGSARILTGYFDDPERLADAAMTIRRAKGIYLCLNHVDPALLARSANRLRQGGTGDCAADTDIVRRLWLPIDLDVDHPSDSSATDNELALSTERAHAVRQYLQVMCGWPDPIVACSGNGAHLLYRIDLPPDDGGLVQRCLQALHQRFTRDGVKVDTAVHNPSRIWKLYGTRACKGTHTPERPHRMSAVLSHPEQLQVVSQELLEALAGELRAVAPEPRTTAPEPHVRGNGEAFDVDAFIARNHLRVSGPRDWPGRGRRWILLECPMCEHGNDGPFIGQFASGAITAGCHHESCSWTWHDLRQRLEPRREQRPPQPGGLPPEKPEPEHAEPPAPLVINGAAAFLAWHSQLRSGEAPRRYRTHTTENPALQHIHVAPEQVLLLGAAPGSGKTAVVMQLVTDALLNHDDLRVLVANVEMPVRQLLNRMLARLAHYPLSIIQDCHVDWTHRGITDALQTIESLSERMHWLEAPYTMRRVAAAAEDLDARLVVVDYVQRFAGEEPGGDTRSTVNGSMGVVRLLAEQGRAVIVVSAISRGRNAKGCASYDGHHGLAVFRESSELEFGVDEAYVLSRKDQSATVDFKHVKARYREQQDFAAEFDGRYMEFGSAGPQPVEMDDWDWTERHT